MGIVWAATDRESGEPVALKFLKSEAPSADARRRFLREASAARAVRHPNVVEVRGVLSLDDHAPVLVMELLSGEPLSARLRREPRMPVQDAAALLARVVSAVGT